MLFIFSTPVLIRHLWQLKTIVFLHWCLICAVLLCWQNNVGKSFDFQVFVFCWHNGITLWSPFLGQGFESCQGILKGDVPLTSCLTGLDQAVLQIKTKIVSCHTTNSKPVKQEVNGIVILPLQYSLVLPSLLAQKENDKKEGTLFSVFVSQWWQHSCRTLLSSFFSQGFESCHY